MTHHVFLLLLLCLLLFSLARLCFLGWLHHVPAQLAAKRSRLPRLLKPRTPDDCPVCRHACPASSAVGPGSPSVRPWREVKSRRGAPKRIDTEGFACPNQQCAYCGITDAQVHALVGDGKHGRAEQIQTFRCQACRATFSARRNPPLYRLKTPSRAGSPWCSPRLPEGLDPSAASRVFGSRQATITTWLRRAGEQAKILHERSFYHLHLPHIQLDELRTRLRNSTHVLWIWLAIDPRTKILPVLHLGSRTQNAAHWVIHSLRHLLAPGCIPLFTSDGLNLSFSALTAHFGTWQEERRRGHHVRRWQVAASLIDGQVKKCSRRRKLVRVTHGLAAWDRGRSQRRLAGNGFLRTLEHGFY